MSQENVDLAYRFADAFNLGFRRLWASILADLGDHEILVDEVIALDEHRVFSKLRWRAEGATSGIETTTPIYTVGTERDGLVSRIEYFLDYTKALEAAGLSE